MSDDQYAMTRAVAMGMDHVTRCVFQIKHTIFQKKGKAERGDNPCVREETFEWRGAVWWSTWNVASVVVSFR